MTPSANVLALGQRLAEALGAACALINETPPDLTKRIEGLRRWYYAQPPGERDRLLWRPFTMAKQTHAELTHAIAAAREALDIERRALAHAHEECETLATQPLPATIEQEAQAPWADAVRRYQALCIECRERKAAIAELERMLPAPERSLDQTTEAVVGLLEAVVTLDREALVRRLGAELGPVRAWFEQLGTAADKHAGEIAASGITIAVSSSRSARLPAMSAAGSRVGKQRPVDLPGNEGGPLARRAEISCGAPARGDKNDAGHATFETFSPVNIRVRGLWPSGEGWAKVAL